MYEMTQTNPFHANGFDNKHLFEGKMEIKKHTHTHAAFNKTKNYCVFYFLFFLFFFFFGLNFYNKLTTTAPFLISF